MHLAEFHARSTEALLGMRLDDARCEAQHAPEAFVGCVVGESVASTVEENPLRLLTLLQFSDDLEIVGMIADPVVTPAVNLQGMPPVGRAGESWWNGVGSKRRRSKTSVR